MFRSVAERRERHEDGVERLLMSHVVGGRALYFVGVCRIGDVLIDSGCSWGRPVLERWLHERPVAAVLTTHEHEDHVGNHEAIQAEMFAPRRAVDLLTEGPPPLPPYRWVTWGSHGKAPHVKPLPERLEVGGHRFEVMPTPGHSSDHVVYLDQGSTALFTGDAYLGRLKAIRAKENLPLQLQSLARMADLDPAVLHPSHGPVVRRPREKLLDTVDHFERLGRKARALHEKGWTPRRIRQQLLGPEPGLTYVSLGGFSAENLIRSLLADAAEGAASEGAPDGAGAAGSAGAVGGTREPF